VIETAHVSLQKVGRYEIVRELGQGGMATIYLGHDPVVDRPVAIKLLHSHFTRDAQFRARFLREARIVASLEHPDIVTVYDFSGENSLPYIVMRYMPGGTLEDRIQGKPMPIAQIIPIVQHVAAAMDYAHGRGIVHRDLKPSNILFDARGYASLSDFGLAKLEERAITKITFSGAMVGTLDYMSPEQALGDREVDPRSDIYALGVILYEMLNGHTPYQADTPAKVLYKHMTPNPPPEPTRSGLPEGFSAIIARALARNPDDRYQSAGEMAEAVSAQWTGPLRPSPLRNPPANSSPTSLSMAPQGAISIIRSSIIRRRRMLMWLAGIAASLFILAGLGGLAFAGGVLPFGATDTPTVTLTATATETLTPTPTHTPTSSPTATETASPTPTDTDTPVPTETPSAVPTRFIPPPTSPPVIVVVTATSPAATVAPTNPPSQPTNPPPPPTNPPEPPTSTPEP
jgi:serine/threonine-protein kinase